MYITFTFSFEIVQPLSDLIENAFNLIADTLRHTIGNRLVASLLADGIISGIGSVLVFIPNIFGLFLILGIMEDSGYLPELLS